MYFVQADLKNFYYQLLLPEWMRELIGIRVEQTRKVYRTRVLPMGWDRSCRTAQALTVGGLGICTPKEDKLGMPDSLMREVDPPGIFELDFHMKNQTRKNKLIGMGAVIYDTILIAVNDKETALWKDRIKVNFESRLGMALKYCDVENKTTFNGVDFEEDRYGPRWTVCDETFKTWKVLTGHLRATPRALWRALGFIRRFAEVHLIARRTFGWLARIQAVSAQQHCEELKDRHSLRWDQVDTSIANVLPQIKMMILAFKNDWESVAGYRAGLKRGRNTVEYIVVDATLDLVSVVHLANDGTVAAWPDARPSPRSGCTIDEFEAFAMDWGLNLRSALEASILVIGGDNTAVSRAFWKGYSLSETIDRHISPPRTSQTVIFVDFPTEDNLADVKTRPDIAWTATMIEQRRLASFERLVVAREGWERWPGDTYFDRRDEIFRGTIPHTAASVVAVPSARKGESEQA